MNRPTLFLRALAIASLLCAGAARAADPATPATPAPMALVSDGASPFRIVVRSPKTPPVAFAAKELAKYVELISGAALEIDSGNRPGPRIVIGLRKDLSAADRKLLPVAATGSDGYAIALVASSGGFPRIVIGGDNPRGVLYGVYDLLERLGCRFVHPALDAKDPEIVPRQPTLTLALGKWAVASPLRYRTLAWFEWLTPDPDDMATTAVQLEAQIDWAMKSRYNVFESAALSLPPEHPLARALHVAKERGMMLQAPGHNFDLFLPSDPKTFAEHPEWFGMRNGKRVRHQVPGAQFCWTNKAAQEKFTDAVLEFVRKRPDLDILELSGLDGDKYSAACECAECAKHTSTDNVIALLNGVVARLAKEAPHVVVETLGGYQYSVHLPKDVEPDPRLRVFWAHWGRPVTLSYSSEKYQARPRLEAWVKAFDHHVTAFQYYSDHYANSWFTGPLAQQIEGDRAYLIKTGIDGMLNLIYPDGYWWRSTMNAYLAGRSYYDAAVDPFVLLREYATSYYGPAGALMAAYLDEWARDPMLGVRSRDQATPVHRSALAAQRAKYLDPAAALVEHEPVYRWRLEKMTRLHTLAESIMDGDIDRKQAEDLQKRGDVSEARKRLARSSVHLEEAKALARSLAEMNVGLVDSQMAKSVLALKDSAAAKLTKALDDPQPSPRPGSASAGAKPAGTAAVSGAAAAGAKAP